MRTRTIILSLLAVFAFSAVAAAAAQARPAWTVHGAELKAGEKANVLSENASNELDGFIPKQLTVPATGLIIVCGRETDTGELIGGATGTVAKVVVKYTGCEVYSTKGEEKHEVSRPPFNPTEKLSACSVKGEGEAIGTITTKALKGTLAYWPGTGKAEVVNTFEPEAGSFVTIEVTGTSCAVKTTAAVTGSVIGLVETPYEEKLVNPLVFTYTPEVVTGKLNKCTQAPTEYETESGAKIADTLKFGTAEACYYDEDWVTLAAGGRFGVIK
jgi:hypothetical protein